MQDTIIKNVTIVNEGSSFVGDIAIKNSRITKIASQIEETSKLEINGEGLHLIPGIIDDQVHFREPGFTHKANIGTESRAAVAGGVTSFMEMPNTKPQATNLPELEKKYAIAAQTSPANYSFFFGATNDNLEEVKKVNPENVCGVKIFMGSSTGDMLVDNEAILKEIFKHAPNLIATHCEDEQTIRTNLKFYKEKFGQNLDANHHPIIRNHEGCYISSSKAIQLAKETDARLHILHISTAIETDLFENETPLKDKKITSEVCVHHLYFNDTMYANLGNKIKCNPAIKSVDDQNALFKALLDNRLDIIATDHAPHTIEEKSKHYLEAPSGLPLVQHALLIMLDFYKKSKISLERIVEKMCHAPAICFKLKERGFIREGYKADLVLIDLNKKTTIDASNILYKCGWSPLESQEFAGHIVKTFVNGVVKFENGSVIENGYGERLEFNKY